MLATYMYVHTYVWFDCSEIYWFFHQFSKGFGELCVLTCDALLVMYVCIIITDSPRGQWSLYV